MTEDLSVHCLVKRLCDSIASDAHLDPRLASRLSAQLFDTAFTSLIGLDPELDIPYVPPEARTAVAAAGVDQACSSLAATSYSELANSLRHLADSLHGLDTAAVLGTKAQELSGAPLALPLTQQDALLSFLLGLQGSQLSVRRRQVTRQVTHEAPSANVAAPLGFSVFNEMPDPYALTNVSSTRALLPSELGYPTHPFAGARDVQDLSAGMSSRPAWNPTATAYAPKPPSTAWLPVAGPLVEMHSDRRKGQRPPPLGLPWSLLSMGLPPGANTTFQALLEPDEGDNGSALNPRYGGTASDPFGHGAIRSSEGGPGMVLEAGGSNRLWSLEEADLAKDAMLALQGVHSALMRLQGALAVPQALPRLSLAGLLSRVAAAAELRQRLQLFVDLHLSSPPPEASTGPAWNRPLAPGSGSAGVHTPGVGGRRESSAPSAAAAATTAGGRGADPVLRAFAAAVGEVLRRQAAALQALQREGAVAWVRNVQVGGQAGRQLHGRGLTPLQVAIHTGRLQSQLQSLAALCWCLPHQQSTEADEGQKAAGLQASGMAAPVSLQQWDSYPRGAALLSFLYQALLEADDSELSTHRFLFTSALAPYLSHLRSWAFTSGPLAPEFATWAEESVAPCLDFEPPDERSAWEARQLPSRLAVPYDPPSFLRPLHAAFMRAGTQLRLLASLPQQGRQLVGQLTSIAERESKGLLLGPATAPAAAGEGGLGPAGFAAASAGLPPLPGMGQQGEAQAGAYCCEDGGLLGDSEASGEEEEEEEEGSWLQLAGAGTGAEHLEAGLLLTSSQLQQVAQTSEQADAARQHAVGSWLGGLALQRHQAEGAAAAAALTRTATIKERQSEAAARQAQQAAAKRAAKANLLRQQSEEVAMNRARAAAQRTQRLTEERELLTQAAFREHAEAVEGLAAALASSTFDRIGATVARVTAAGGREGTVAGATAGAGLGAGAVDATAAGAGPAAFREKATSTLASAALAGHAAEQTTSSVAVAAGAWSDGQAAVAAEPAPAIAVGADAACPAAALEAELAAEHGVPTGATTEPAGAAAGAAEGQVTAAAAAGPTRRPRRRWQHIEAALGSQSPKVLPALAAFDPAEQHLLEGERGEAPKKGRAGAGERPAPLAAVLEMCVVQGVLSQYRAVSKACVRLFLDDLRLLEHLEALRRLFFMGAGDWAEALVSALTAHADSLEPLSQHALERLLQGAARGTSVEQDPFVSRLRVRLLPGLSIVNAQVQAVALPTPRRGHTRPRVSAASLVVPPNSLDGMDCIMLDYDMGWPLSAVITEDIMQGYSAVFSMLVRLKRVELLLRSLYAPLMMQPKSTPDVVLSEEEADRAYRRLQQLRGFRGGAAQLVAAVQAFLQSRISGEGWARLLASLMVSSERVALRVLQRGPSAALAGALSRMGSTAGSGSAAHRLLRMAKSLSRTGSFSSTPPSQPDTPFSPAAATQVLETAAAALAAAPGGPGPSRFAPGRSASAAAAAPASEAAAVPAAQPAFAQQLPPGTRKSNQEIGPRALPGHLSQQRGAAQQQGKDGEEGAIADLQELLNLHRAYIRGASADCLTLGGCPAAREGMDATLQAALDWALQLQAAVRLGAAGRAEDAWVQVLRRDSTWGPLAEGMAAFDACLADLHAVLRGAGSRGVLAELALQLDYNGYYARRQQQCQAAGYH